MKPTTSLFLFIMLLPICISMINCELEEVELEEEVQICGCTYVSAENYNPEANCDDGSCITVRDRFIGKYEMVVNCSGDTLDHGGSYITIGESEMEGFWVRVGGSIWPFDRANGFITGGYNSNNNGIEINKQTISGGANCDWWSWTIPPYSYEVQGSGKFYSDTLVFSFSREGWTEINGHQINEKVSCNSAVFVKMD